MQCVNCEGQSPLAVTIRDNCSTHPRNRKEGHRREVPEDQGPEGLLGGRHEEQGARRRGRVGYAGALWRDARLF